MTDKMFSYIPICPNCNKSVDCSRECYIEDERLEGTDICLCYECYISLKDPNIYHIDNVVRTCWSHKTNLVVAHSL